MKAAIRSVRGGQAGVSLIEVLVSLVISLFVIGAVLMNFVGTGTTGRQQGSLSQMSEDAQLAFSLMSRDIQMAGYSDPSGIATVGGATTATFGKLYSGNAVFGCESPLSSESANTGATTCVAGGATATHSIEVNFQATPVNSLQTSTGTPTDCLGNGLAISGTFYVASNRYYVTPTAATLRPELHCGSPGRSGQPLVENVEAMAFWYGVADAGDLRRAVRYVTASNVADWGAVVSVRICLLMRSPEPVLTGEDSTGYTDCYGTTQTQTDRRIYRAFYSTVTLRNKAGF